MYRFLAILKVQSFGRVSSLFHAYMNANQLQDLYSLIKLLTFSSTLHYKLVLTEEIWAIATYDLSNC